MCTLSRVALPITAFVVAINFVTMPAEEYPGDASAVRAETITLLNSRKWAVPPEVAEPYGPPGQYFYRNAKGAYYPKYGVLNTLMYVPPLWLKKIATGTLEDSADNTFFLNLLNVVLSGVSALYLVLLARRYTRSTIVVSIFVLASLFSTFWWNYLRTQTFEIYHTLFLIAFFYHFMSALEGYQSDDDKRTRDRQFFVAAIYFGALCLSKTVYVVLLPAIVTVFLVEHIAFTRNPHQALRVRLSLRERIACLAVAVRKREVRVQLLFFWLPVVVLFCLLALTNWYKFDSPFASGYTQWELERQLFKPSNLPTALWGYLFGPRYSVFLHYPLFFFALAGWPDFFRKHRSDAVFATLIGLSLLLVSAMFVNWRGQSSYGPRYLLPVLPILSLPFLEYLGWLGRLPTMAKSVLVTATTLLLAYFILLQVCVNTLPFFFSYDLRNVLDDPRGSKNLQYFRSNPFGAINRDFLIYRSGYTSPLTQNFVLPLNQAESVRLSELTKSVQANYYWFPNLFGKVDQ